MDTDTGRARSFVGAQAHDCQVRADGAAQEAGDEGGAETTRDEAEFGGPLLHDVAHVAFHRDFGGVELSFSDGLSAHLRAGDLDVALLTGSFPEATRLLDDPMFVALPRDHRLAARRVVRRTKLALVGHEDGAAVGKAPVRRWPPSRSRRAVIWRRAMSRQSRTVSAWPSKARPSSVSRAWALRSERVAPSSSSSMATWRETADCV